MTSREQILQNILTKLKTLSGIDQKSVVRSRTYPFDTDKLPFLSLKPLDDPRNEAVTGQMESQLKVRISLWVEGDIKTEVAPETAADPIVEQIDQLLLQDRSLGLNFVVDVLPSDVSFEFSDGNKPEVQVDMEFVIGYRTNLTF
jgi:hypothetical protein